MNHNKMHWIAMGAAVFALLIISKFVGGAVLPLGFLLICFGMMAVMMIMMGGGGHNDHKGGSK